MLNWEAEHWAAFGACAAVVVYVVLGLLAWRQLRETARLRELQTRPYVVVDFEFRRFLVMIAIRNTGSTPARDVEISFDKPLQTSDSRAAELNALAVFTQPIPMMAPGRSIRIRFDAGPDIFASDTLPKSYTATVRYRDHSCSTRYEETYVLDLMPYKSALLDPKGMPELVAAVEGAGKTLRKWSDGSRGLRVSATNRTREAARERREYRRERRAQVWHDGGLVALVRRVIEDIARRR